MRTKVGSVPRLWAYIVLFEREGCLAQVLRCAERKNLIARDRKEAIIRLSRQAVEPSAAEERNEDLPSKSPSRNCEWQHLRKQEAGYT